MNRNDNAITFISKYLYFKNTLDGIIFADIIKFRTVFTETTFKDSRKYEKLCIKI